MRCERSRWFILWLSLVFCSHHFKHSRLHTRLQGCTANIHAVDMQLVPWSAVLNDLRPESTVIPWNRISLALTQSALLLFFPARHSLSPFPFYVALFVGHWCCMGYFWNWGSPLRVVFPPYRRGHTDPFLLCDRRLFPEKITWHDNRHACTSLLTLRVLTARLEPNCMHLSVFKL